MRNYGICSGQRWTRSARDCYFIGCNCSKCYMYKILGEQCKMKRAVLELVRKFGKPERDVDNED